MSIVHSVVLDEERSTRLRQHATTSGLRQSEIVRQALDMYFAASPEDRRLARARDVVGVRTPRRKD